MSGCCPTLRRKSDWCRYSAEMLSPYSVFRILQSRVRRSTVFALKARRYSRGHKNPRLNKVEASITSLLRSRLVNLDLKANAYVFASGIE
jgi:hypothetical protein